MADQLLEVRPNQTLEDGSSDGSGAAVGIVGHTTHHGAQSDNTDASYTDYTTQFGAYTKLGFADPVLPANALVRRVRALGRARMEINEPGASSYVSIGDNTNTYHAEERFIPTQGTTFYKRAFSWYTSKPSGGAWTQTALNGIRLHVRGTSPPELNHHWSEAYIEIEYNVKPSVTVTTPAEGTTTTEIRPTVAWSYTDPENDAQTHYQVRVFTQKQYNVGGFNPGTSTAYWDSGKVTSSSNNRQVGKDLSQGTYRAYVKVWQASVSGQESASGWDYNQFTVNNNAPTVNITEPTANPTYTKSINVTTWTYSDPEGDPQEASQVIVETGDQSAQAIPGVGTELYNETVQSTLTSRELPALSNGTYTVWVRASHSWASLTLWSAWDKEPFTISMPAPAMPSLTLSASQTFKYIRAAVDSNSAAGQEAEEYDVQYSDGNNTGPWYFVRGGNGKVVDPVDSLEYVFDFESPPGAARYYRARAARYDSATGSRLVSAWAGTPSETVTITEWHLKDVFNSANNVTLEVENESWNVEHPLDVAVFNPLGRKYPVVIRESTVKAARFELTLATVTEAAYKAIVTLWESGHPMLLQVPRVNRQHYVHFASPRVEEVRNLNDPFRGNILRFIEIERPAV